MVVSSMFYITIVLLCYGLYLKSNAIVYYFELKTIENIN